MRAELVAWVLPNHDVFELDVVVSEIVFVKAAQHLQQWEHKLADLRGDATQSREQEPNKQKSSQRRETKKTNSIEERGNETEAGKAGSTPHSQ